MRFIYILILFATLSVKAQSPTWRLFHPGDIAYYKPLIKSAFNDYNYAWFIIDSLPTHLYTRYYFHKNLMGSAQLGNATCIADNNKGWAGIRADVTDTSVVFYNRHDLPILFKTNTKAGDKWPVNYSDTMQYYFEHVRDTVEQVINGTDSMRWYYVKKSGSDKELYRLALSKHHGMFYMFNVWHFLDSNRTQDAIFTMTLLDDNYILKLMSRKSIPGLLQNFSLWDCYPYQPGDVVHEIRYNWSRYLSELEDWDSSIITIKYLERNFVGDSILLLKRVEHKFIRKMNNGSYSQKFSIDTNTILLPNNTDIDREPGYPIQRLYIPNVSSQSLNMLALRMYKEHPSKKSCIGYLLKGDGPWCANGYFLDASPDYYEYIKDMGVYLIDRWIGNDLSVHHSAHYPIYYKQGSKTWGTPYPFILGEQEYISTKPALIVYPNPGKASLNFSIPVSGRISIADMSGKIVYSREWIQPQNQIDADLPEGVYVIEIRHDDGAVSRIRWVCMR